MSEGRDRFHEFQFLYARVARSLFAIKQIIVKCILQIFRRFELHKLKLAIAEHLDVHFIKREIQLYWRAEPLLNVAET